LFLIKLEFFFKKILIFSGDDIQASFNENNFIFGSSEKSIFNKVKSLLGSHINSIPNNSNIKIMTSEYEDVMRNNCNNLDLKNENNINNNNILILNNSNKNTIGNKEKNNFYFLKNEQNMLRKRARLSSCEGFWNNFDYENIGCNHKKSIDEIELLNSFGQELKYDFNEEELEQFDECLKNTALAIGLETSKPRRRSKRYKLSVKLFVVYNSIIDKYIF